MCSDCLAVPAFANLFLSALPVFFVLKKGSQIRSKSIERIHNTVLLYRKLISLFSTVKFSSKHSETRTHSMLFDLYNPFLQFYDLFVAS